MRSSMFVAICAFTCLAVSGCTSEVADKTDAKRTTSRQEQVAAINRLLDEMIQVRTQFERDFATTISEEDRRELIARVQEQIRKLDSAGCPRRFRNAFADYQQALADYLPVMMTDLAPWSTVDFRNSDSQDRSDSPKLLGEMEDELSRNMRSAEKIRSNLKVQFSKMREVGRLYGINLTDVDPFQGPLANGNR